jgi:hypothetical protein
MEKKTIVAFRKINGIDTYLGEHNINEFTYDLYVTYENRLTILKACKENSILCKFVEDINLAILTDNFDILSQFGIIKENLGKKVYMDDQLQKIDLAVENDGTGYYNNVTCKYYEDCTDLELELINTKTK